MAVLLSGTTIGGNAAIHAGNISTYALTSIPTTISPTNIYVGNAIYFGGANNYFNWDGARINSNVGIQSAVDMRAPIFYDSNNTDYYLDPNNRSRLSSLSTGGVISTNDSFGANLFSSFTADGKYMTRNWSSIDGGYTWPDTTYRTGLSDAPIGSVAIAGSSAWSGHRQRGWTPIDQTKTYKISVWIRATSGNPYCYLSLTQATYDLGQPNNGGWGNPYFWSGVPSTSWTEYTMTIGPSGSGAQYNWNAGTKYVQLGWLHNYLYSGYSGQAEISGFKIEELDDTLANNVTVMGNAVIHAGNIASQSVSYAVTSGTSSATTQTNFAELFIENVAVATKEFVTSQGYLTSLPSHNHDDRYYTESESDGKYLIGTTNPGSVANFTISIGNNGSYSYVQSHSGQPLYLNPVGNSIVLNSTTTVAGTAQFNSNTTWFSGGATIGLENQSTFARFAFYGLSLWDWDHGEQMVVDGNYVYVNNYLQAGNSLRAPIFYDSNDTGYYLDPNSQSNLLYVTMPHRGNGVANIVVNTGGSENWNAINVRGGANDHMGIGYHGTSRSVFGTDGISIHFDDTDSFRLHTNGWDTEFEVTGDGRAWLKNSLKFGTSTNNGTISGGGDWGIRFANDNGWIQFGPANNSWTHIYSDKSFYFNQDLYVNGTRVVLNSGTWSINISGNAASASSVDWYNVSNKPADWLNQTNLIQGNEPNTSRPSGFYESYLGGGNPTGTWFNYINVRHSNPGNVHGYQLGMSYYDNNLWFRSYQGNGTYMTWSRALGTDTDPYPSNMNQYVRTSDSVTFGGVTSPTILVNNQSDNTKGYRIWNTSNTSVSAMFVNSANALVIGAGAFDQVQLNKKTFINGAALGVNVAASATAGRIDASNDIVAYSSSDERLKENIAPIENALDKVKSLTGVEFDWKPEYKHAHGYEGHDTGIIAQQVQAVMPSAVRTNDTGFLAVRYEKLIGLLIEANKELAARVEELEKKIG